MNSSLSKPIRHSVKILLFNQNQELLLLCADDPQITNVDGKYYGKFWFTPGGEIEPVETLLQAAIRELNEETGFKDTDVIFGPVVWFGEFELKLKGILTQLKQKFMVAHLKPQIDCKTITLKNLTQREKKMIQKHQWFSIEQIYNSTEPIFPVVLKDHLPAILEGRYPEEPFEIDCAKQPTPPFQIIGETPRILVRTWIESDAEAWFSLSQDEGLNRFSISGYRVADLHACKTTLTVWSEVFQKTQLGIFPILAKQKTSKIIGICALKTSKLDDDHSEHVEIMYRLGQEHWKKGFATEAGKVLLKYAFQQLHLSSVIGFTVPENTASRAVLLRLGMKFMRNSKFLNHSVEVYQISTPLER